MLLCSYTTTALLSILLAVAHALPKDFVGEQVFRGSSFPTDIAFTPAGEELVVVQKKGFVSVYLDPDGDYSYSEKIRAIDLSKVTCSGGERGLGGVQVHLNFGTDNRFVYMYYTYDEDGRCLEGDMKSGPVNRLSRFVLDENWKIDRNTETVLLQTAPLTTRVHNGGKIEFGPDGYLYLAIGDGGRDTRDEVQNLGSLFGSIVRLTDDGEIPVENPFYATGQRCHLTGRASNARGKCQELYAIGFRNPWRLNMNPNSKVTHFRVNDVGGNMWEEISEGGKDYENANHRLGITNYGWPVREGPCGRQGVPENKRMTNCNNYQGFEHPVHFLYHKEEGSCFTGGAFVPNGVWPEEYNGAYLFGNFVSGDINVLRGTNTGQCLSCNPAEPRTDVTFFHRDESIITMRFGPYKGGSMALYYTTNENGGSMKRIFYSGDDVTPNKPPVARITVDPGSWVPDAGSSLFFSGIDSTDPDDDTLLFEWDFDDDGIVDSRLPEDSHAYGSTGTYTARLTVQDGQGAQNTVSTTILVGTPNTTNYPSQDLPWQSAENCPAGFDYCGVLEFCQQGDSQQYGYRLPCDDVNADGGCPCDSVPGPLIRLIAGKKYRLTLRNVASEASNLHTHGLHIVGAGDSDDVTRLVGGGGYCLNYTWDIPADHPGGTNWYHAHRHGHAEKQVGGGAYGMLIVEDNENLQDSFPAWAANELLLQVFEKHDAVTGNGKQNPVFVLDAYQWYRLRVSFVSVEGTPHPFRFDKTGCDVHKVATDGIWRSKVPGPKGHTFSMSGASRADFAIRCNQTETLIPLSYGGTSAATLFVGQAQLSPDVMQEWEPVRPNALSGLLQVNVPDENKFSVRLGYDHVNDLKWNPLVPMATLGFNQVHEWTLRGTVEHPFHMHLYHMQVVTPGGCGEHEEGEFYDVIASPNTCIVRFKTADIGQRCVLHCHVLLHEDNGSMAWVNVTGPNMPRNDVKSYEFTCTSSGSIDESRPTLPPASSPQPSPQFPPSEPTTCTPFPVLLQGADMTDGDVVVSPLTNIFMVLEGNGNLVLRRGSPVNPGPILWESGVSRQTGAFYMRLQRDGNLVTRMGTPLSMGPVAWSSRTGSSVRDSGYFLAFNCDGSSISIYRGTPSEPLDEVWRTDSD